MATDSRVTSDRLGKSDEGRAVSAEEFDRAEFDQPWTYEREAGRLLVMSPEGIDHVLATNPWRNRLILFQYSHPGIIREVVTQSWVRPDGQTDRVGDIGVYLANRPFDLPNIPPDLMFEIVSPGRASRKRDYVVKRGEYETIGIKEYVIVDPQERRVTVLTLGPIGYGERMLKVGEVYTSALLPGLEIPLDETFGA